MSQPATPVEFFISNEGCRLCVECARRWPAPDSYRPRLAGLDLVAAAWPYRGTVRSLIVYGKDEVRSAALPLLVAGLEPLRAREVLEPGVLVWPPSSRRRSGGWHLARAVARALARRWGWRPGPRLVRRRRRAPQAGLSAAARRRNLRGTFAVARSWRSGLPRRAWIVDDVLTTGATLRESARALREAGVERVGGLAVARVTEPTVARVAASLHGHPAGKPP